MATFGDAEGENRRLVGNEQRPKEKGVQVREEKNIGNARLLHLVTVWRFAVSNRGEAKKQTCERSRLLDQKKQSNR